MMNRLLQLPVFVQVLLIAILATAGAWLLLPAQEQPYQPDELPWNSRVDQAGHVHALGLITGQSTLADAMSRYGRDVEVKLFTDAHLTPVSVEAFFPTIYIGAIKAPMILRLQVPPQRMQALLQNAPGVRATPTGSKEALLSDFQARTLLSAPIEVITLVVKKLPEAAILKRFGPPVEKRPHPEDGTVRWHYPGKGLEIILDPEGPALLQWAEIFAR